MKKTRTPDPRAKARGQLLRELRTAKQLSQEQVGAALGWSRENVSQLEAGYIKEIERPKRLDLCKLLGTEERELLLDKNQVPEEFDMPLSRDAKSIAYRWDDLPQAVRDHLTKQLDEMERLLRQSPELAEKLLGKPSPKKERKK